MVTWKGKLFLWSVLFFLSVEIVCRLNGVKPQLRLLKLALPFSTHDNKAWASESKMINILKFLGGRHVLPRRRITFYSDDFWVVKPGRSPPFSFQRFYI